MTSVWTGDMTLRKSPKNTCSMRPFSFGASRRQYETSLWRMLTILEWSRLSMMTSTDQKKNFMSVACCMKTS